LRNVAFWVCAVLHALCIALIFIFFGTGNQNCGPCGAVRGGLGPVEAGRGASPYRHMSAHSTVDIYPTTQRQISPSSQEFPSACTPGLKPTRQRTRECGADLTRRTPGRQVSPQECLPEVSGRVSSTYRPAAHKPHNAGLSNLTTSSPAAAQRKENCATTTEVGGD